MQQRQRQTFISTSTRNNNINRTFVFLIRFNEISLEYQTTRKTLLIHILHKIATTYFSFSMSMPSMTFPFERLNQRKLLSIFSFLHIYNLLMKKKRVRDRQELPFSPSSMGGVSISYYLCLSTLNICFIRLYLHL